MEAGEAIQGRVTGSLEFEQEATPGIEFGRQRKVASRVSGRKQKEDEGTGHEHDQNGFHIPLERGRTPGEHIGRNQQGVLTQVNPDRFRDEWDCEVETGQGQFDWSEQGIMIGNQVKGSRQAEEPHSPSGFDPGLHVV
jgi:hypothetical protein